MTRVKICGLTRMVDVEFAASAGADALGFVMEPSSPRCLAGLEELRILAKAAGPYCTTVAVFGEMIESNGNDLGAQAVQAISFSHDLPSFFRRVRTLRLADALPHRALESLQPEDSALLIDAFDPHALGGTGRKVDWDLAAEIVAVCPKPVILAGGLTPENVADAIQMVRPYAVDVSSGVESAIGIKDFVKVRDFIRAAHEAL